MNRRKRKSASLLLWFLVLFPALSFSQSFEEKELFGYVNNERSREDLPLLEWDEKLYKVALAHSKDMATQEKVSHMGSDGSEPEERIRSARVYGVKMAENVARDLNVISAHTSLMESLAHRENILDPDFTHGAAGIVRSGKYLYVTELFVGKLKEISDEEGRRLLLDKMNAFRERVGLLPLVISNSLNKIAQKHVLVQERLNTLSPPLLMNLLARKMEGGVRVNVYTTGDLNRLPEEVYANLRVENQETGIGVKSIRGKLCEDGCYLVTLIFGRPNEN